MRLGLGLAALAVLFAGGLLAAPGGHGALLQTTSGEICDQPIDNADCLVAAVEAANQGGSTVIDVAGGTYDLTTESPTLDITAPDVELTGVDGRDQTTILLDELDIAAADVTVQGLTLTGPGMDSQAAGPVVLFDYPASGSTFEDSAVSGGSVGVQVGGSEGSADGSEVPASGVTIEGNTISGNENGIDVDGSDDNTISENTLNDNGDSQGVQTETPQAAILLQDTLGVFASGTPSPRENDVSDNTISNTVNHGISIRLSNVSVTGNHIVNSGDGSFAESAGIEVTTENSEGGPIPTIGTTISGTNVIAESGFAGIKLTGDVENTTIDGNVITDTSGGGETGREGEEVPIGGSGILFSSRTPHPTGTTITGNAIVENTGFGIALANEIASFAATDCGDCRAEAAANPTYAHDNAIVGNGNGEVGGGVFSDPSLPRFDATNNWWGASDGPSGSGPGSGDSVNDFVDYSPFLSYDPTDTTPPVIDQHEDMTAPATSASGAVVDYTVTASDDSGATITPTCAPASGSVFSVGSTTVTCNASDPSGNQAQPMSFKVTVTPQPDTTPPVIDQHADVTVQASSSSGAVVDYTVTASDDSGATIAPACAPASGTVFSVGSHTVTCNAQDPSGNAAAPMAFTVTVTAQPSSGGGAAPPDVAVSLAGPADGRVGKDVVFTATVRNGGGQASTGTRLSVSAPSDASVASVSSSQGSCSGSSCAVGTLEPGASASVSVTVVPSEAGTLTVTTTVSGDGDSNHGNDSASASTPVVAQDAAPPAPPVPTTPGTYNALSTGTVLVNGVAMPADTLFVIKAGDTVDVTDGIITFTTVDGSVGTFSSSPPPVPRRTAALGGVRQSGSGSVSEFVVSDDPDATRLTLVGGDFSACTAPRKLDAVSPGRKDPSPTGKHGKHGKHGKGAKKAKPHDKTVIRQLWGKAKGHFRTKARFSAATIRGTVWGVEDRCDGTLTTALVDVVDVQDLVLNKTVTLQPGQTYLAQPRQQAGGASGAHRSQTAATVKANGLHWGGRIFLTKKAFAGWLSGKGAGYSSFARKHPALAKALAARGH